MALEARISRKGRIVCGRTGCRGVLGETLDQNRAHPNRGVAISSAFERKAREAFDANDVEAFLALGAKGGSRKREEPFGPLAPQAFFYLPVGYRNDSPDYLGVWRLSREARKWLGMGLPPAYRRQPLQLSVSERLGAEVRGASYRPMAVIRFDRPALVECPDPGCGQINEVPYAALEEVKSYQRVE